MDLGAQAGAKSKNGKGGKPGTDGGKDAREAYYDKISKLDMAPLWVVLKDIIPDEPKTVCAPGDLALQGRQAAGRGSRIVSPPRRRPAACWCWRTRSSAASRASRSRSTPDCN